MTYRRRRAACRAAAVSLTALKDQEAVDRFSGGIDTAMQAVMGSSNSPSCTVVVVADNRISTINGYGDPFDTGGDLFAPELPA